MPFHPVVEECPYCHRLALYEDEPGCRACNTPLASRAPNVHFSERFRSALEDRYREARTEAEKNGASDSLAGLEAAASRSMAVANVDVGTACDIFSQPKYLYTSYGKLVEAGVRAPAAPEHDRHRTTVDGLLYGSYGKDIAFAALSIDGRGLTSYGSVHLELDEATIDFRATVLEDNSFHFVRRYRLVAGDPLPDGFLAPWRLRAWLAVAKLASKLRPDMTEDDFCKLLLESNGNRDTDVFLEVHVYGTFNFQAVRRVKLGALDTSSDLGEEAREVQRVRLRWLRSQLNHLSVEWSEA